MLQFLLSLLPVLLLPTTATLSSGKKKKNVKWMNFSLRKLHVLPFAQPAMQ